MFYLETSNNIPNSDTIPKETRNFDELVCYLDDTDKAIFTYIWKSMTELPVQFDTDQVDKIVDIFHYFFPRYPLKKNTHIVDIEQIAKYVMSEITISERGNRKFSFANIRKLHEKFGESRIKIIFYNSEKSSSLTTSLLDDFANPNDIRKKYESTNNRFPSRKKINEDCEKVIAEYEYRYTHDGDVSRNILSRLIKYTVNRMDNINENLIVPASIRKSSRIPIKDILFYFIDKVRTGDSDTKYNRITSELYHDKYVSCIRDCSTLSPYFNDEGLQRYLKELIKISGDERNSNEKIDIYHSIEKENPMATIAVSSSNFVVYADFSGKYSLGKRKSVKTDIDKLFPQEEYVGEIRNEDSRRVILSEYTNNKMMRGDISKINEMYAKVVIHNISKMIKRYNELGFVPKFLTENEVINAPFIF